MGAEAGSSAAGDHSGGLWRSPSTLGPAGWILPSPGALRGGIRGPRPAARIHPHPRTAVLLSVWGTQAGRVGGASPRPALPCGGPAFPSCPRPVCLPSWESSTKGQPHAPSLPGLGQWQGVGGPAEGGQAVGPPFSGLQSTWGGPVRCATQGDWGWGLAPRCPSASRTVGSGGSWISSPETGTCQLVCPEPGMQWAPQETLIRQMLRVLRQGGWAPSLAQLWSSRWPAGPPAPACAQHGATCTQTLPKFSREGCPPPDAGGGVGRTRTLCSGRAVCARHSGLQGPGETLTG